MSLRFLYRKIQVSKRICSFHRCGQPILRNIARDQNGHLYHYGCLQSARDEQYRCLECYQTFDATEAGQYEKQTVRDGEVVELIGVSCPSCGSQNVKSVGGLQSNV